MSTTDIELGETDSLSLADDPLAPSGPSFERTSSHSSRQRYGGNIIVTRRVKEEFEEAYRDWSERIRAALKEQHGLVSVDIYEPDPGHTDFWTYVVRFDSFQSAQDWRKSEICKQLMEEVEPMTLDADIHVMRVDKASSMVWGFSAAEDISDKSSNVSNKPPPKPIPFKQVIAVLTCLYPTVLLVGWLLGNLWLAVPEVPVVVRIFLGILLAVPLLVTVLIPQYMSQMGWYVFKMYALQTECMVIVLTMLYFAALGVLCNFTWTVWGI